MDDKFIHAATADYEVLYNERDMILYIAGLLLKLHECDPENYHIDSHWESSRIG